MQKERDGWFSLSWKDTRSKINPSVSIPMIVVTVELRRKEICVNTIHSVIILKLENLLM